ncbi:hypothetical protein K9M74_02025 [Candidatus Woesearchaeota archaeon]|nr:hypothetical protein [Candidatus Woesearchaeota archaeon]
MSRKRLSTQQKGMLFLSMVVSFFITVLIPLLRNAKGNPFSSNLETYTHLIAGQSIPLNFYDAIINFFLQSFSPQLVVILIPLLLALGSLILFTVLIFHSVESMPELIASLLVFVLTPAFLAMHVGLTLYSALLFFSLLAIYLYLLRNYFYLLFLGVLFLLNPFYATLLFAGIFFLEFFKKQNKNALLLIVTYVVILLASGFLPFHIVFHAPLQFNLDSFFSFLGGRYGYSLFLILLGIGGFLAMHVKVKLRGQRALQALLLIFSIVYEPLRILGIALLSYYAVQGFVLLFSKKWHTHSLQQLTALLFVCILLFSTTSYIQEEIRQAPTQQHVQALTYLRASITDNPLYKNALILAPLEKADFIEFFTGLSAYRDDTSPLFDSQSFSYVSLLLNRHDVAFIFIDPAMLQGAVWQQPEEGLLFVMKYNEQFKKIYDVAGYEIYYFLGWDSPISS